MPATNATGRDTPATLYTLAQAAHLLGMSERTLRRRAANGEVEAIKVGGAYRIPDHAIAALGGRMPANGQSIEREPARSVPATAATDAAPLVDLIERQGAEIARLSAALAVAEERLRQLTAGSVEDAAQTPQDGSGATQPAEPASTSSPPPRRFWRDWLREWLP